MIHYVARGALVILLLLVAVLIWKTLEVFETLQDDPRGAVIAFDWLILLGLAVYIAYSIVI